MDVRRLELLQSPYLRPVVIWDEYASIIMRSLSARPGRKSLILTFAYNMAGHAVVDCSPSSPAIKMLHVSAKYMQIRKSINTCLDRNGYSFGLRIGLTAYSLKSMDGHH
jgi:hypothetical protein